MKDVTIGLDDDLYDELVKRAGGPRKISKYLNPLLRTVLAQQATAADSDVAELRRQMTRLAAELATVTQRLLALEGG